MADDHDDDRQVRAYERMLERLNHYTRSPPEHPFRDALDTVKRRAVELGELTREEADRIGEYLRRDIDQAARYLASGDKHYRQWLHMDIQMIEHWLADQFSSAVDHARVDLLTFREGLDLDAIEEYHAGEIAAPGSLTCLSCSAEFSLPKAGVIQPCATCQGRRFVRTAQRGNA